jgi:ATP-dependent DNA ligase
VGWRDDLDPELAAKVVATPMPEWLDPMAATLTEARFDDADWVFERKIDGFRFIGFVGNGEATLLTRNKIRHRHPMVEATLLAQPTKRFVVDGEIVNGIYSVFDILWFDGYDVTKLPLYARKRILETEFGWIEPLELVEALPEDGVAAYERACREGWEGVMAKRRDSVYEHKRSRAWLKMKCDKRQEFVVGGFTEPSGARSGFGALLIGYYDGEDFVYAGKLGTGFNFRQLDELYARMTATELAEPPFTRGTNLP